MYIINSYVHHDRSKGVLAKFSCGSDFTARTAEFKQYMDNICLSLVADEDIKNPFDDVDSMEIVNSDLTLLQYEEQMSKTFQEQVSLISFIKMTNKFDEEMKVCV